MFFKKDYSDIKNIFQLPAVRFFGNILDNVKFKNGIETRSFNGQATFLIPCYKKANFIEDTVKSCLNQTVSANVIVLLMDKDSQLKKDFLEKDKRVKCICSERKNVVKAREFLVEQCPTDWFVFLDADDLISKNYIEVLGKEDGAIRFGGTRNSLDEEKPFNPLHRFSNDEIANVLCYNNTALMHKDVFYDIGYDETLCNGGEDTDFTARLLLKKYWKVGYNTDAFYVYQRETENQLTRNWKPFHESIIKSYMKGTPVWIDGMSGLVQSGEKMRAVRWVLEDFSEERLLAFFYFDEIGNRNYKWYFDKFISQYYTEMLFQSQNSDKEELVLKGGRVYSFEDILEKEKLLPDTIKNEVRKLSSGAKLFYVLKNYKCEEDGSSNNREILKVDNFEWSRYAEKIQSDQNVKDMIENLKQAYNLNYLPDD